MRISRGPLAAGVLTALFIGALTVWAGEPRAPQRQSPGGSHSDLITRGRYLVMIAGCNDCHTAGFAQAGGTTPESEWLTGDTVGWRGPWGTTYPTNVRLLVQSMSEEGWVGWARTARTAPPMPYWALNAMTPGDLRAVYQFIRSLGPRGVPAPADLPPGQIPSTPSILFPDSK